MSTEYFDISNFTKFNDNAYLYKHFLSQDECNKILSDLDVNDFTLKERPFIKFYYNFVVDPIISVKVNSLLTDKVVAKDFTVVGTSVGGFWSEHQDSYDYTGNDVKKYGGVIYLNNDYVGGEINYTEYGISHKPDIGDMVLHTSTIKHSVSEVLEKERFAITFILESKK